MTNVTTMMLSMQIMDLQLTKKIVFEYSVIYFFDDSWSIHIAIVVSFQFLNLVKYNSDEAACEFSWVFYAVKLM